MPKMPIVDSHVHLWDPAFMPVPWMEGNEKLGRVHMLDEYNAATEGLDIEAIVYLEIDRAPAYGHVEARHIARLAEVDPRIKAIVAWAPLEDGDRLRPYLADLGEISPLVKGVRRITQDIADPDFILQPGFLRGAELLPEYGLTCDLCCMHRQITQTVEAMRRVSGTQFVLDHIGKPNIRGREMEPWASAITDLATLPNVVIKVSGATTEADLEHWTTEDVKPYVLHVLNAFGEDRVMFGSDWPVVTLASTHRRWVDTLDELTQDLSESAKRKLWHDNAARFYRI